MSVEVTCRERLKFEGVGGPNVLAVEGHKIRHVASFIWAEIFHRNHKLDGVGVVEKSELFCLRNSRGNNTATL